MTTTPPAARGYGDRIKLPLSFDVGRMRDEVCSMNLGEFLEYSVLPLRSPAHLVNPDMPAPLPVDDYADGTWTEWLDTPALKDAVYLSEVVDNFRRHTRVTLVRLLRLEAGAIVREHTDPTLGLEQEKSVIRLTIPIQSDDEVTFYLNSRVVPMKPGECWYLRLTDRHRITNAGTRERINMSIDMAPNRWLRSLLANQ